MAYVMCRLPVAAGPHTGWGELTDGERTDRNSWQWQGVVVATSGDHRQDEKGSDTMSTFDELMSEVLEATGDESIVSRIKEATAASPLRKERDEWKSKAETIATEANELRGAVMSSTFKAAGIAIAPAALNIPSDLNYKDAEAVRAWGESMGLVAPQEKPPTDPAQAAQFAKQGAGANSAEAINKPALQVQSAKSLADLVAQAQASGWSGKV